MAKASTFIVQADYSQFYIIDKGWQGEEVPGEVLWDGEGFYSHLGSAGLQVGVGCITQHPRCQITIEMHKAAPALREGFDHIVEVSLPTPNHEIEITGWETSEVGLSVPVKTDYVRLRCHWKDIEKVYNSQWDDPGKNAADFDEAYLISAWPQKTFQERKILKMHKSWQYTPASQGKLLDNSNHPYFVGPRAMDEKRKMRFVCFAGNEPPYDSIYYCPQDNTYWGHQCSYGPGYNETLKLIPRAQASQLITSLNEISHPAYVQNRFCLKSMQEALINLK